MDHADIKNRFTYHAPQNDTIIEQYAMLRLSGLRLAILINDTCPDSREKSLAITKLEEVIMWANAAIARNTKEGQ